MKFFDIHQDLALSYVDQVDQFFNYNVDTYVDTYNSNVWNYISYKNSWVSKIFGAVWPYSITEKKWNTITSVKFEASLIDKLIDVYRKLSKNKDVYIIENNDDLQKEWLGILIHIEWYDWIPSLNVINELYKKWVRSMWFVWNNDNHLCHCNKSSNWWLTKSWIATIYQMNALWMVIDTAHMNHRSMMEVLSISSEPIINSHSNLKFFNQSHSRNVEDSFLHWLYKNEGVLWLSICKSFLWWEGTIEQYLDQIAYIIKTIWDENVCFWSDYHWLEKTDIIEWLEQIDTLNNLSDKIIARFWSSFANKFFYTNIRRVLKDILS